MLGALPLQPVMWSLLGLALLICAVTDLTHRRIPNAVTFPAMATGLLLRLAGEGLGDLHRGAVSGLLGAAASMAIIGLAGWLAMRLFGAVGSGVARGDLKLLATVGVFLGWPMILTAAMLISLAGSLQTMMTLVGQGAMWGTAERMLRWLFRLRATPPQGTPAVTHVPYALAIAVGAVGAMWLSQA